MERFLVISSDCHAGLPPEQYRAYVDPEYREAFDLALPIQTQMMQEAARKFLVANINAEWRRGREEPLTGAWDHEQRLKVLDGDGIAGEIIFPDGITEMNTPPFGAGLSLPTENVVPESETFVPAVYVVSSSPSSRPDGRPASEPQGKLGTENAPAERVTLVPAV